MAGRCDLGRNVEANDDSRWMETQRRTHSSKKRHTDAQFRGGSDALQPDVSCRRFRAHRSANRRQRIEPRGIRCPCACEGAERILRTSPDIVSGRVLRRLPAPRLESAAFLVVDDIHAPSIRRRNAFRSPASGCRSRLPDRFTRGDDEPGRTVRWSPCGGIVRIRRSIDTNLLSFKIWQTSYKAFLSVKKSV